MAATAESPANAKPKYLIIFFIALIFIIELFLEYITLSCLWLVSVESRMPLFIVMTLWSLFLLHHNLCHRGWLPLFKYR